MSNEINDKKGQNKSEPKPEIIRERIIVDGIGTPYHSIIPNLEGYQPTDKLDTSNPPTNKGKDNTK